MNKEECREVLFSLANSINALRSAKVGNKGFSIEISKEFALRLEEAIHSTFSIKEEQVLKTLEDVRAEIEALGTWHDKVMIETVDINRVLEVIDNKIKEISGKDCRDCKKWNDCECGKKGHDKGTSIGYSVGECAEYEVTKNE